MNVGGVEPVRPLPLLAGSSQDMDEQDSHSTSSLSPHFEYHL